MARKSPLALASASAVVVAVVGGVGFVTVGEAFNAGPSARQQITTPTVSLTTSAAPVAQGAPVMLIATVTPAAAGTVQFKDGITNLGSPVHVSNGTASGSTSLLSTGSHSLIAVFTPRNAAAYGSSASQAVVVVSAAPSATTTTLTTSPPSPVTQGAPVTLTATVAPATAAGSVQFKDGATNLGAPITVSNGVASVPASALVAGTHQLTAVFTPTDTVAFSSSTSPQVLFVINPPAGPVATTTGLTTSPASPVAQGTPVTLTATIAPATATGTVQFKDGTRDLGDPVPVTSGTVSGVISTLPVGTRSLTAVFTPSAPAMYSSSTSTPVDFMITAPPTRTTATSTSTALTTYPGSPIRRGTPVRLFSTVSPTTAAGTVQFKDGVVNIGNPVILSNGTASTPPLTFAAGSHQLSAVFVPTNLAVYASSSSPVLILEVTEPGVADLAACLRVLKDCPTPRAGTPLASRFDHLAGGGDYVLVDRLRNIGGWIAAPWRSLIATFTR